MIISGNVVPGIQWEQEFKRGGARSGFGREVFGEFRSWRVTILISILLIWVNITRCDCNSYSSTAKTVVLAIRTLINVALYMHPLFKQHTLNQFKPIQVAPFFFDHILVV